MNLQHLHSNSQTCNCRPALELTRGGLRMSRPLFALYMLTAFTGGIWVTSWTTALLTR